MGLDKRVNSVCKPAFFYLRNIGSIRNMLTDNACSQLIQLKALVTVCIDYCNTLLYGIPGSTLFQLQNLLNTAARIPKKILNFLTLLTFSKTWYWLTIRHCNTLRLILLSYQAYHNTAPNYLCELISLL